MNAQGQLGIQGSSLRYKDDIRDMAGASRDLHKLRPVTFRYKPKLAGKDAAREYGSIAEEVAEVYPELVGRDAQGKIVTVKYHELIRNNQYPGGRVRFPPVRSWRFCGRNSKGTSKILRQKWSNTHHEHI